MNDQIAEQPPLSQGEKEGLKKYVPDALFEKYRAGNASWPQDGADIGLYIPVYKKVLQMYLEDPETLADFFISSFSPEQVDLIGRFATSVHKRTETGKDVIYDKNNPQPDKRALTEEKIQGVWVITKALIIESLQALMSGNSYKEVSTKNKGRFPDHSMLLQIDAWSRTEEGKAKLQGASEILNALDVTIFSRKAQEISKLFRRTYSPEDDFSIIQAYDSLMPNTSFPTTKEDVRNILARTMRYDVHKTAEKTKGAKFIGTNWIPVENPKYI